MLFILRISLEYSYSKFKASLYLATTLANFEEAGKAKRLFIEAENLTKEIDKHLIVTALLDLAKALADNKYTEKARLVFSKVQKSANAIEDKNNEERLKILRNLATTQARCGGEFDNQAQIVFKELQELADGITENNWTKALSLLYLANALAKGGKVEKSEVVFSEAIKVPDTFEQGWEMVERLREFADNLVSSGFTEKAKIYLLQARESIKDIQENWERAEAEEEGSSSVVEVTHSGMRGSESSKSIDNLINLFEAPIEAGIPSVLMQNAQVRGAVQRPNDVKQAKADLEQEVESSLSAICEHTTEVGQKAVTNLLLMDVAALRQGLEFVSKDAAHLIDEIIAGVGGLILRLVKTAIRLLAQVYNWIRTLLGKEIEAEARQQVGEWLKDIKQEQPDGKFAKGFFGQLVKKIYNPSAVQNDVKTWVASTQVEVGQINQTTKTVEDLAKKHEVRTKQIDRILTLIAFVKKIPAIKTPQGQVITAAVLLGVLVYTLYSGYDHIRDGQIVLNEDFKFKIPDRVVGIRETVQQTLGFIDSSEFMRV